LETLSQVRPALVPVYHLGLHPDLAVLSMPPNSSFDRKSSVKDGWKTDCEHVVEVTESFA